MKSLLFTAAILAVAAADPEWNDFRGSFLIMKDEAFAPFPRTIRDEIFTTENWTPVTSAEDCTNGGVFNGVQYVKAPNNVKDYSVGLLFDKNGVIAGIQMMINKTAVQVPGNPVNYAAIPMYNSATHEGQDYFFLTAYLVQPDTICETGRTDDDLTTGGTGSGLWFQTGATPANLLEVPRNRPEGQAAVDSGWTENNCFPAMGFHNFHQLPRYTETNCAEMSPVFPLYSRGSQKVLHGFGFITPGTTTNPRFEHPPETAIRLILGNDKTPQCVIDMQKAVGVTSLHVYFKESPWFITCPVFSSTATLLRGFGVSAVNWFRTLG